MHRPDPGSLADRSHPTMCSATVEALAVAAQQDRALAAFADGKIDRPACSWYERDHCWLVSLTDDPQRSVPAIEADVLDVGLAGLAHAQSVQAEQHRERGMGAVDAFSGEQEPAQLGAIEAAPPLSIQQRATALRRPPVPGDRYRWQ